MENRNWKLPTANSYEFRFVFLVNFQAIDSMGLISFDEFFNTPLLFNNLSASFSV